MFLWILACTGTSTSGDTGFTATDLPPEDETCATDVDCDDWELCEDEECVNGDLNNGIDEAEAILWEQVITGYLQTDGDQDFYSFQADGGEWVRIDTEPKGTEEDMDTVVTLYDPKGKVHHVESEHPWGNVSTYDTVMYTYLPDGGTWSILVEDANGLGSSGSQYDLRLIEVTNAVDQGDSFNSPGYELDIELSSSIWAIGVLLEDNGDEHYIHLALPWENCPVLLVGSQGERGSEATPTVELYANEDLLLLHKEGLGLEGTAFYPEVNDREATIVASDADGGGSADHWFYVYVQVFDEGYSYTHEIEGNNDAYDATDIELVADQDTSGSDFEWGGFWGTIDDRGDEDWFAFNATNAWYLHVRGQTDSMGSLLLPELEIYDESGLQVTGTVDANDGFPDTWNVGPLDGGRYTVRVSSANPSDYGPEMYYTARIDVTDYTATISQ
jgi:hypothetical protein